MLTLHVDTLEPVTVLSIGMSCVYAGSRTLMAMAEQGYAPKVFAYVDKAGRPLWSVLAVVIFYPLAYINCASVGTQVFNWLLALSGLATIFTWMSIMAAHVRFRLAWKKQGHSIDELPFRALGGIWGSLFGIFVLFVVLIAQVRRFRGPSFILSGVEGEVLTGRVLLQFYIGLFPVGGVSSASERAQNFFLAYCKLSQPFSPARTAAAWWTKPNP